MHIHDWLRTGVKLFTRYVERHGYPDVIHAHGALAAGRLARIIGQQTGVPYVLTEHSTAFSRNVIRPWQDFCVKDVLMSAAARIVVSPALGTLLERRYESVMSPWQWIPNVVSSPFASTDTLRPSPSNNSLFRFLNVALLTTTKGHDTLLQAMSKLVAAGKNIELRIAGDGALRPALTRLAIQFGVAVHVTFLGTLDRDDVVAEMQAADAFVLSSRHETFGVVLIEALACGLPVVATKCGGPECILGPDDGLLVPPDDPSALARAMEQMMEQRLDYSAAKLRERCLARFGEEAVAAQIAETYTRVLAARKLAGSEQAA